MGQALAYARLRDAFGPKQINSPQRPRHPAATGGPTLDIDLVAKARLLQCERYGSGTRNAMTLMKRRDFRLVLATVKAGARLARHTVRGTVLIQVLRGHVQIRAFEEFLDATAGHVLWGCGADPAG